MVLQDIRKPRIELRENTSIDTDGPGWWTDEDSGEGAKTKWKWNVYGSWKSKSSPESVDSWDRSATHTAATAILHHVTNDTAHTAGARANRPELIRLIVRDRFTEELVSK